MTTKVHSVLIIGSGPAGLTAAIYAARANLRPLVVEGFSAGGLIPGGQLMFTTEVENYPGYPKGITGQQMMADFREQAERQGAEFITDDVWGVELGERPFKVYVGEQRELHLAKAVIIATGARANYLGLPSEEALKNKGVSACAVCDGALFRGKDVAVVGGGDTAMEEAHYLAGLCESVTLIHRRDEFRASQTMQRRVLAHPKIRVLYSHVVEEVLGVEENTVRGLRVRDLKTDTTKDLTLGAMFVAIGHTPLTDLFKGQLEVHDNGYLKVEPGTTRTSVPGVFAAGDVADHVYRQAVTAAGTGCMAALDAERWLGAQDD
ncbi:MAG: thioredoxin-disulfide reductase [Polyangiaceae bacterium]|nr:thioredoxin-disulfide reductase [Polyangiaceae bacterium]MCW5791708.1 thioredoxin-disulfide reductase [Polyangiaceae bacterium]